MTKLVTFTGSAGSTSKTAALVKFIAEKSVSQHRFHLQQYDMSSLGRSLGLAESIDDLSIEGKKVVVAIQSADALIIGTPVYKGSYPGLFKHFIDLLDPHILYGKPILLAATGGGSRHALAVEHQLRPLMGFFMAHSLPTAIYASSQDYADNNQLITPELITRIEQAVDEFSPFFKYSVNESSALNLHFKDIGQSTLRIDKQ